MALIYEGNTRELVKRNKEYIELAKRSISRDIEDTVIIYWIDELGDRKKDFNRYMNEVLPTFKRWYNNGVSTLSIGTYYDLIKSIEDFGVTIDRGVIIFILGVSQKYNFVGKKLGEDDIHRMKHVLYFHQANGLSIDYKLTDKFEIPSDNEKSSTSSSK